MYVDWDAAGIRPTRPLGMRFKEVPVFKNQRKRICHTVQVNNVVIQPGYLRQRRSRYISIVISITKLYI